MSASFKYICSLIGFACGFWAAGQNVQLRIIAAPGSAVVKKLNYNKKHTTRQGAYRELEDVILSLQYKGYLLAAADSIYADTNSVTAIISQNDLYKIAFLHRGNLDPNVASKLGISEKLYFNQPFRYQEVARVFEKIITHYENSGYPFVTVSLDSISTTGPQISAVLNVKRNRFFKIDSIKVIGTARINRGFLNRYLSVREQMPYNEVTLEGITRKIMQLPFVTQQRPAEVRLTEKTNRLLLFLDKKNASQFDGIIGFLPDADTRKTIITGDVKLKLVNGIFRNGETFDLEWRRLQSQTQDFNGRVIYPYLFGTPVGVDYNLKIYRRDTTFIDINNNTGIQYYFSGLNNFKIFYKQRNTSLLSTSGLDFVTTLPDYADISTSAYGVGTLIETLDYRFNPHKGISINVNIQAGNRTIHKNPKVNASAYDNLLLRSTQYQGDSRIDWYITLHGNNVLHLGVQAAGISGNSVIFRNELFRIGGLKTLRGFDEESIYTSAFVIPTIEYRFLFAQNSNILLFTEGAWYENNSNHKYLSDTPVSVGAGVNFETKAGILSLNYAIGNQFGNGFDVRSGKIHFGLTALF
jgi:outer membrane protein assembly factor BamA